MGRIFAGSFLTKLSESLKQMSYIYMYDYFFFFYLV